MNMKASGYSALDLLINSHMINLQPSSPSPGL